MLSEVSRAPPGEKPPAEERVRAKHRRKRAGDLSRIQLLSGEQDPVWRKNIEARERQIWISSDQRRFLPGHR